MNSLRFRLLPLVAGLGIGLAAATALADDTEIFFGSSPSANGAKPNILFLYDNSGSMASEVVTQEPWDTNTKFDGCFDPGTLYYSTNGSTPGCGSGNTLSKSANYCAASATPLANLGQYADNMLAWRSSQLKWVAVSGANPTRPFECQVDRGVHGQTAGSANTYAANGAGGPWAANATNEPSWSQRVTIFDGNWLNWNASGGTVTKTRIQIIQEVTDNLLNTMTNVNVGLETFNYDQGGYIAHQMQDIATSKTSMQAQVDALTAANWTPLSESLYEAMNYYYGRTVDYGNVGPVKSVAASRVGNTAGGAQYLKPVNYACQKNYIVILTDGLPTHDTDATAKIKALPSWASTVSTPNCSMSGDGACMIDLAEYMNKHDLDASMPGLQNVITYTVGFGTDLTIGDSSFLEKTAQAGGGKSYLATDTATLSAALTQILISIMNNATTYTSPTAPVNAFNRLQNLNDLFVSVFQPDTSMHWPGNLKKYRLQNGMMVGQDLQPAVDPSTGFFAGSAFSYWSPSADGNTVTAGGAASQLPVYTGRNLFTNVSGSHLNISGNAVTTANTAVTAALVGAPSSTDRNNVINWARGLDLQDENDNGDTTDTRHVMGDPMHVRPVSIIYGGTAANPDMTIYVATNDGYLHAINAATGAELWSFIPQRLLSRLYGLYLDNPVTARSYGLDGEIRPYIVNDDGNAGISGSERVLLFFGMRRGGDSVYALDVTNRSDPQVLWEVNSGTAGFNNLGETFSPPSIAKVNIGGTTKLVAIFGGGYDDGEDNPGYRTDTVGRSIYMVDALTGAQLWRASSLTGANLVLPQMTHSIPAGVLVLDMDGDGLADRMYVGDMGGRVWRFDIYNGQPVATLVTGGVLASLGAANIASPAAADVRRFYATPDVAAVACSGQAALAINIGSGHREHPLDTGTADEFYSIRDYHVLDKLDSAAYVTPITRASLTDITGNAAPLLPASSAGWRLSLTQSAGEKVVTESRTFANTIFFSSFAPGAAASACTAAGGTNRFYEVNACDAHPVTNLDSSPDATTLTVSDRLRQLKQGGIAPEPVFLFTPNDAGNGAPGAPGQGGCVGAECQQVCVAEECGNLPGANTPVRTIWTQLGTE